MKLLCSFLEYLKMALSSGTDNISVGCFYSFAFPFPLERIWNIKEFISFGKSDLSYIVSLQVLVDIATYQLVSPPIASLV